MKSDAGGPERQARNPRGRKDHAAAHGRGNDPTGAARSRARGAALQPPAVSSSGESTEGAPPRPAQGGARGQLVAALQSELGRKPDRIGQDHKVLLRRITKRPRRRVSSRSELLPVPARIRTKIRAGKPVFDQKWPSLHRQDASHLLGKHARSSQHVPQVGHRRHWSNSGETPTFLNFD